MKKFYPYSSAVASGWMNLRGTRRRRSVDRGFAISDHADWDGLNQAVKETGAEKIIITHGYRNIFARWLNENHYDARVEDTLFEGELSEIGESTIVEEKE
jgi:putative mRNA 3-end processing factor